MSDHNDSVALGVDTFEFFHNGEGRVRVEVAGWFVGKDDFWVGDDGAGDGDALLLTARELIGVLIFFFFHIEAVERFGSFD